MSDAVLKAWHLERPAPLPRLRSALGAAAAGVALLLVMIAIVGLAVSNGAPAPTASPPPRPTWIDIPKPVQIFDLSAHALEGLPLVYSARRLSVGEGREDVLSFGQLAGTPPAVRLKLWRRAEGPIASAPLFAALAREAADVGLAVERSGLPDLMTTRFGKFEIADLSLTSPNMLGREIGGKTGPLADKSCSGFRLVIDKPALSMTGLACGAPTRPISRADLACLLDRLDLASAGDDRGLRDFFAATELTRNAACEGMHLGPDGLHAAWLDDKPAPRRKAATLGKSLRRR